MRDLSGLEFLIHPMPVEVFIRDYWEQKILHIQRNDPGYYAHLFTLRDLDSYLGHSLTNDEVRWARAGHVSFPRVEGDNKTSIYEFYEAYKSGWTSVIRNVHLCWEPIGEVASALAKDFGCYISTHLYPTPEESQGFTSHWDDHDIFALQLDGAKEWRLYDTGPKVPRYSLERNDYRRQHGPLGEPFQIINLEAGDLLYFPKGVIHEPRARTRSSLHLTFGLYPETWENLIAESIHELSSRQLDLQDCLPFGFLGSAAAIEGMAARAAELAAAAVGEARFEETRIRLAAKVLGKSPPITDGHFAQLGNIAALDVNTQVEKRKDMVGVVVPTGNGVVLHFPGGTYAASIDLAPALRFVARQDRFSARNIPGPSPERERLDLVRDLVQAGFLRRVERQSSH